MLVKAFVDESGTGGEPRVMLGALVARAHRWIPFARNWQKLLDVEEIEFSHITDMENKEPPFEDWGQPRTAKFVLRAFRRIEKNCDFGLTVSMSTDDYKKHYREKLSSRAHKDSRYGLCARALIETVVNDAIRTHGPDTVVNFVFENNPHFEDARRVFTDMKTHLTDVRRNLGTIAPGAKDEFAGVQVADIVACLYRRAEPRAQFKGSIGLNPMSGRKAGAAFPMYRIALHEKFLAEFCEQAEQFAIEKRGARRRRAWEKRKQPGS